MACDMPTLCPMVPVRLRGSRHIQYRSSSVTEFQLSEDGLLIEASRRVHNFLGPAFDFSPGPNLSRQEAPHPHGAFWHEGLQDFIIPDLGGDKLRLLRRGDNLPCRPGSGPRHIAIHPEGKLLLTTTT